ncbi:hypothetical protein BBK36DRAFT_1137269 [Trichoderma citrinoviride]|uniref:Uncharacterized protein n=1 Tax=Trichoderma citrinoviride TaxID=58853 RepID=A0A2T4BMV1_9HYPO|nr:hypothetical protein BBK36DRAFT_1137269 [Trichoderma citrinoviride]PTB70611.1 hypothetical protein BBK36DRAFT_1137269 [Trichoderma citrinoviride]
MLKGCGSTGTAVARAGPRWPRALSPLQPLEALLRREIPAIRSGFGSQALAPDRSMTASSQAAGASQRYQYMYLNQNYHTEYFVPVPATNNSGQSRGQIRHQRTTSRASRFDLRERLSWWLRADIEQRKFKTCANTTVSHDSHSERSFDEQRITAQKHADTPHKSNNFALPATGKRKACLNWVRKAPRIHTDEALSPTLLPQDEGAKGPDETRI